MLEKQPSGYSLPMASLLETPDIEGIESWMTGARFTVVPPNPIELSLDPETGERMFVFNKTGVPLMRNDLIGALHEIGITNLDIYPARIYNPMKDESYGNFHAVNIIGAIAAADLTKSKWNAPTGEELIAVDFDGLTIDESRCGNALIFRLAECVSGIVVHEKVRDHLLARGFKGLGFIAPEEWTG
jgi:hypothetical protein